ADYAGARRPAALRVTKLGLSGEEGPTLSASEARRRTLRLHGVSTLAHGFPSLARAREAARSRRRPEFGPFEGRIRDAALRTAVETRLSEKPLSPSAVEMFAKCSYRFFFARVLKLRAFDEASERGEIDDLGRGSLFHDAARRIVWERRGVPFSTLDAAQAGLLSRRHAAEALAAWEEENGYRISPALLREIAESRLVEQLEAWLRHERSGDFAPTGAEVRFGPRRSSVEDPDLSSDDPVSYDTAFGERTLAGRIDLVAVGEGGSVLRVTDFKVPRKLTNARRISTAAGKGRFVFGGELAQLPVYAQFAAETLCRSGAQPENIRGEYLFVGPENAGGEVTVFPVQFDVEARGPLLQNFSTVLDTMESAIRQGVFRPQTETFTSKTPCFFCDYQTICGPGHVKRYASKKDDPDLAVRALAALEEVK
ncbi:MAG: PD-(D/E)XK nuclease family protein, partial [Acidobacteriota bacterium]